MIITYVGKERCDILYHILAIGRKTGKKIVAIDNSITHDLFSLFEKDDQEDIVQVDNLVVCKEYCIESENENYDYTFIYEGLYPRHQGHIDFSIIAPGYEEREWEMIKPHAALCMKEGVRSALIIRDKTSRKFADRSVGKRIGIIPSMAASLKFSMKEYTSYIALTHNNRAKLSMDSESYEIIAKLATEIYDIKDAKTFKRLVG